jgi:cell filamentation protein
VSGPAGQDPYLDPASGVLRNVLGDVFAWAGELRTVSIAKGSVFCLPQHLAAAAADVFGRLAAADRLRSMNREQFIGRAAEFLADVNAHPSDQVSLSVSPPGRTLR